MADLNILNPSSSLREDLIEPFVLTDSPILDENGNSVRTTPGNPELLMLILQELRQIRIALMSEF